MFRYTLQTLRARKGGFIGAFLALFCAAMLVTACGILLETGLSGTVATQRYAGAAVVVGGDQQVHETTTSQKKGRTKTKTKSKPLSERVWLPADTVDRLSGLQGASRVVPELTFTAYAVNAHGQPTSGIDGKPSYGHAWTSAVLTPFTLVQGSAPQGSDQVVVDRELAGSLGLHAGSALTVESGLGPQRFTVSGVAAPRGGDLAQQTSLFFSDGEAATLAGHPGQVSAVGVVAASGVSADTLAAEARQALAGTTAQVHTGGDLGPMEFLDASNARIKLVSMGGAIGGTSLLVAILVVVGTFALAIQQRYRELALLRAIAATPKQVRKLIGREALLVGGVAGVTGAVAGLPVAYWLHDRFVALRAIPDTLQVTFSVFPFFAAIGATLLGAWAAARISARRAARIRPAEALAEAAVERRPGWGRLLAGILVLAGGGVLLAVLSLLDTEAASSPVTFLTVVVLAVAVSLLGPVIVRAAVTALGAPLRLAGVSGHLAAANTRAGAKRAAAAITPLALLIAMASTVFFVATTTGDAAQEQARAGNKADWVVAAAAPGVPEQAVRALRQTPGVTAVTEVLHSSVRVSVDKYTVEGLSAQGLTQTFDPGVTSGSLDGFGDGSVALSKVAASGLGKKPGDILQLTLGDGTPVTLTVDAVYRRGLGFGDLTVSHDLLARHVDDPLAGSVLVKGAVDRAALTAALHAYPGVAVLDRGQVDQLATTAAQSNAAVNYTAMGLIIAFTAIAAVNTLAMTVSERIREFALLRLVGTTRRQVMRMLRLESAVVVLLAAVLGTGIALAVLTAFSLGMTGSATPSVAPWRYLGAVGLTAALALAATIVPGRVALTASPADVIGARQ